MFYWWQRPTVFNVGKNYINIYSFMHFCTSIWKYIYSLNNFLYLFFFSECLLEIHSFRVWGFFGGVVLFGLKMSLLCFNFYFASLSRDFFFFSGYRILALWIASFNNLKMFIYHILTSLIPLKSHLSLISLLLGNLITCVSFRKI